MPNMFSSARYLPLNPANKLLGVTRLTSFCLFLVCFLCYTTTFAASEEEDEKEAVKPVAYYSLSPSIVTNVQGRAKYIRCDIQLMTKDEENIAEIKLHSPAIRHELLLLLSEQDGEAIQGSKGKEKLRKTALKTVQSKMKELSGEARIDDLFFTSYFVQ